MSRSIKRIFLISTLALVIGALPIAATAEPARDGGVAARLALAELFDWFELSLDRLTNRLGKAGPIADPNGRPDENAGSGANLDAGPIADPNG